MSSINETHELTMWSRQYASDGVYITMPSHMVTRGTLKQVTRALRTACHMDRSWPVEEGELYLCGRDEDTGETLYLQVKEIK